MPGPTKVSHVSAACGQAWYYHALILEPPRPPSFHCLAERAQEAKGYPLDVIVNQDILGSETEADVTEWLVEDGSEVAAGQPLAELETSKVQVEVRAPLAGVITLIAAEGDVIEPGAIIAKIV